MRSFIKDERAIGWVLGVAIIAILLMPVVYFPLDYAWDLVFLQITGDYTFTGTIGLAVDTVRIIINYLLVFGLLIVINWAVVQAKARSYSP